MAGKELALTISVLLALAASPATGEPSSDVIELNSKATALYSKGDYKKAINTFQAALANDPDNAELLHNLSLAEVAAGDLKSALYDINSAIRAAASDARLYDLRGSIHLQMNFLIEAILDFDHAIALNPRNIDFIENRKKAVEAHRSWFQQRDVAVREISTDRFVAVALPAKGPQPKFAGWSKNFPSQDLATEFATDMCRIRARSMNCRWQRWGKNGCLSMAAANDLWFIEFGATSEEARSKAYGSCLDAGGTSCEIKNTACAFPPPPPPKPASTNNVQAGSSNTIIVMPSPPRTCHSTYMPGLPAIGVFPGGAGASVNTFCY